MRCTIGILASVMLIAACSADRAGPTQVMERDSAGITILSHPRSALFDLPRWSVTDSPIVVIGVGAGDPAYELHYIKDVDVTSSGDILILDGASQEVRVFDPDGRYVRSMGRRGSGPGEFFVASWLHVMADDSIVVHDVNARRFSIFAADGVLGRDVSVSQYDIGIRGTAGLLRNGAVVIPYGPFPWESGGGLARDTMRLRVFMTTGEELADLGRFPGDEFFWLRGNPATSAGEPRAFGRSLHVAARDSLVYIGLTDEYEIGMYSQDGALRRIVRLDREPVPVTPPLIDAWKRSRRALYGDSISRARFGRVHDAMPFPATMPAFSQLAMDTDHNLWVRNYPTHPDSTADWLVFDAYGRLRASIHLPDTLVGIGIQSDRIIGQWSDDEGVESVRINGIRRDS